MNLRERKQSNMSLDFTCSHPSVVFSFLPYCYEEENFTVRGLSLCWSCETAYPFLVF